MIRFDNCVLRFPQGLKVATGAWDVNQLLVVAVLTPLRPSPPILLTRLILPKVASPSSVLEAVPDKRLSRVTAKVGLLDDG